MLGSFFVSVRINQYMYFRCTNLISSKQYIGCSLKTIIDILKYKNYALANSQCNIYEKLSLYESS